MSSQLVSFVSPITGSLESLQNQFSQLAALHREAHASLRLQGSSLTTIGGAEAFIGDGARAFTDVIEYYIGASEKHMQLLDNASRAAGSCISEIMGAVGYASSIYLDEGMVGYVIERLTQDTIIREGAAPVGAIINEMRSTVNNMVHTGGNFFGHLFHGQFGGSLQDIGRELAEAERLAGYVLSLLDEVERVLSNWAQDISQAVRNCLGTIQQVAEYTGTFLGATTSAITQFESDLKSVSFFKKLIPILDSAPGQGFLFGGGVILDYISGGKYDLHTFVTDLLGGGVGFAVGLTPPGRLAMILFGAIQVGGAGIAWGQSRFADTYKGAIGEELKAPATDMELASEDANLGKVFDDIGSLILDTEGMGTPASPEFFAVNSIAGAFGVTLSEPNKVPTDIYNTFDDTWKLANSVPQFAVSALNIEVDDLLAWGNSDIQNLPLPDNVKHFSNGITPGMIHVINDAGDYLTKHSDMLLPLFF